MTEREKFLERWSRKKREAVDESAPSKPQDVEAENKPDAVPPPATAEAEKPFDLESLPSLESITAETDIRDFLQPSVPADLKREALRRAWSADPGIRDFIGLAENSGDFNDPTAMPGFGPIEPSEVARLMAQFVLTPAEEKKIARAPETLADQRDEQDETSLASDSPAAAVNDAVETQTATETHGASQKEEAESDPVPPLASGSKFPNS
jgi:hypothetical protein